VYACSAGTAETSAAIPAEIPTATLSIVDHDRPSCQQACVNPEIFLGHRVGAPAARIGFDCLPVRKESVASNTKMTNMIESK